MTYMPDTNLSNLSSDGSANADPTTVEKLKALAQESTQRAQRISKILKQAFSETREEFQAGRTVISPIAKEVTAEAVSTFKTKSQQAAEAVNQAWQEEESTPDFTERLIKVLKTMTSTARERLYPQLKVQTKKQASRLDELLGNRYGKQYDTFKGRFEQVRTWVNAARTVATEPAADSAVQKTGDATSAAPAAIEVDSQTID
ncbi:MAG: hypothetical protein WA949_13980 [Phormidesmis sp.]